MPFKSAQAKIDTTERDLAAQVSRDCEFCNGTGLVPVYHPTYRGDAINVTQDGRRYAATTAAHCSCRLGVWMREHVPEDVQRRIPRVEDIVCRFSRWLLEPPEAEPFGRETGPACPRCAQPMHGGHGGLPWECLRACSMKPLPASRNQPRAALETEELENERELA